MSVLTIADRIAECDDGKHRERGQRPRGVSMHMFGVPGVHDLTGIALFYRMNPGWTGGQMPYTFGTHPSGFCEQGLPIDEVGPHALRWSSPTVGVVCIGDFNAHPVPETQWNGCVDLVAELLLALGVTDLKGHTERPEATKSAKKNCPGKYFDMDRFRADVFEAQREAAIQRIRNSIVAA